MDAFLDRLIGTNSLTTRHHVGTSAPALVEVIVPRRSVAAADETYARCLMLISGSGWLSDPMLAPGFSASSIDRMTTIGCRESSKHFLSSR
jgi:hypothetical protein